MRARPGRLLRAAAPAVRRPSAPAAPGPAAVPAAAQPFGLGMPLLLIAIAIGAIAMWPIYAAWQFALMAAAAAAAAVGVVLLARARRWRWWSLLGLGLLLLLLLGVPLAVPSGLAGPEQFGWALVELLRSTVLGWKQLLTITVPVGAYQGLLVPAFLTILIAALGGLWLLGRSDRWWAVSLAFAVLPFGFAVAFGPSAPGQAAALLGLRLPAAREVLLGALLLLVLLLLLRWRSQRERSRRLRAAEAATGVRSGLRARARGRARSAALSVTMLAAAALIAVWLVPPLVGADRQVLRTAVLPELELDVLDSPLAGYRRAFTDARLDARMLVVEGDRSGVDRLRLAVLSHYDGEVFRTVDPVLGPASQTTAFRRLPYRLSAESAASARSIDIAIDGYDDAWLPTAGAVDAVAFAGPRAGVLQEGFFYAEPIAAGVQTAGFEAGDRYRIEFRPAGPTAAGGLVRPADPSGGIPADAVPESVTSWVRQQELPADGAGLAEAVRRLRDRGYLSHSLLGTAGGAIDSPLPDSGGSAPAAAAWVLELQQRVPGFRFESSLPGHTMARIDALFDALLTREAAAGPEATAEQLVAAVGDDEQFAVAAALVAREFGFPARVVVGFRLASDEPQLPVCAPEGCRGGDLAAWIEVRSGAGEWLAIDATPQSALPVSEDVQERGLPRLPTEVREEAAEEQRPAGVTPGQGGADEPEPGGGLDLLAVLRVAREAALWLLWPLTVLSPLLVLLVAKRLRRRRRLAAAPGPSIVGAWDEFAETGIDWGLALPERGTRREQAAVLGTPQAVELADQVDRAVFGPREPGAAEVERAWRLSAEARRALGAGRPRWRRLLAQCSPRSFLRYLRLPLLAPRLPLRPQALPAAAGAVAPNRLDGVELQQRHRSQRVEAAP